MEFNWDPKLDYVPQKAGTSYGGFANSRHTNKVPVISKEMSIPTNFTYFHDAQITMQKYYNFFYPNGKS